MFDFYAKPFELTFKGEEQFRTFLGSFISLVVIGVVVLFAILRIMVMINFEQSTIRKNTMISINNSYMPPFNWGDKNVTLMFTLGDISGLKIMDNPKFGRFILRQQSITKRIDPESGVLYSDKVILEVPFDKCKNFPNIMMDQYNLTKEGFQDYYCAKWTNLTIQGQFISNEYKTVQLLYQKCQGDNNVTCATDEEFKNWGALSFVEIHFISSFIDPHNFEQPIQKYRENLFYPIDQTKCTYSQLYLKKTNLKLYDSWLGTYFGNPKEDYLFSVGQDIISSIDMNTFGKDLFFFQAWRMYKEYDEFQRDVYSIQNILQDVGGFQSSINIIAFLIYIRFRNLMFYSTLIRKLFQIEDLKDEEDEDNQDKEDREDIHSILQGDGITNRIINPLMKNIQSRVKIRFSFCDYVTIALLGRSCSRNKKSEAVKKRLIFMNAEEKVRQQLDCVSILHKLQMVDLMSSILMNQAQKVLFYYQKKYTISYEQFQRADAFYMRTFSIKKMQKAHDLDRALQTVCNQEKLKSLDKRLLWGLVSNYPLHLSEKSKEEKISIFKGRLVKRRKVSSRINMITADVGIQEQPENENNPSINTDEGKLPEPPQPLVLTQKSSSNHYYWKSQRMTGSSLKSTIKIGSISSSDSQKQQ